MEKEKGAGFVSFSQMIFPRRTRLHQRPNLQPYLVKFPAQRSIGLRTFSAFAAAAA